MIAKRFRVVGRVQGVFFRGSACTEAGRLGLVGWVTNLTDGSVEAYACGDVDAMRQFEIWLGVGPPNARVTDVAVSAAAIEALPEFSVR